MPYADPNKAKEFRRQYYLSNREEALRYGAKRYRDNHDFFKEENRRRYRENPEPARERERQKRAVPENKIKEREYKRAYLAIPAKRLRELAIRAGYRAKRLGIPYEENLPNSIGDPPSVCPCCGKVIDYSTGRRFNRADSPSIDQIIPRGGYTLSNVVVVCMRCNEVKRNSTIRGDAKRRGLLQKDLLQSLRDPPRGARAWLKTKFL